MGRREEQAWAKGTLGLAVARERGDIDRQFQNRLMVTRSMIDRLGLEKELKGHMGCVNCLEWNADGSVLASASDDLHVILWDPYRYKQLHNIATGHTGNIFSVKFLSPDTIVTCAADSTVRARSVCGGATLLECSCHCGRVKRLAAPPDTPHLIWSAGEDGLILQHDLRTAHRCNSDSSNVLINLLNHLGRYAEAKCVAVNPRRPYQLAVGANDFYVRLYDTRMVKLAKIQTKASSTSHHRMLWERQHVCSSRAGAGDPENNILRDSVHYFAPGHLSMEPNEHTFPKKSTTYVAFSNDGNELLVNLGSEQVYLFDLNNGRSPVLLESFIIQHNHGPKDGKVAPKNGTSVPILADSPPPAPAAPAAPVDSPTHQLPDHVKQLKETANGYMAKGNYSHAVEYYNRALAECQNCAILYSNRAAALMRRGWAGDTYAAVRDCYTAIRLEPAHVKSHFRLAKGLMELRKVREAHESLLYFKDKFPRHASSHAVFLLQKDINTLLEANDAQPAEGSGSPGSEEEGTGTQISALEKQLRATARDYTCRFLGHCNTTTDIKEANFLGPDAEYIAAGSDDGSIFIWSRRTGNIVRCLRGDESIVNCIQMHPSMFLLATSGIEAVVRLWSPRPEDGQCDARRVADCGAAAAANQQRMRSDPFEAMLLNISFAGADRDLHSPACRPT